MSPELALYRIVPKRSTDSFPWIDPPAQPPRVLSAMPPPVHDLIVVDGLPTAHICLPVGVAETPKRNPGNLVAYSFLISVLLPLTQKAFASYTVYGKVCAYFQMEPPLVVLRTLPKATPPLSM